MTEHLPNGALKDHLRNGHIDILSKPEIVKNVTCIKKFDNVKKHKKYEALIILK